MSKKHLLFALISVILWGINFPLLKFVFIELPPLLSVATRLLISSLLFLPFVSFPKKYWYIIVVLSFTLFTATLGSTTLALKEVDAAIAALITELEVPFAAILSFFLLNERLTKQQLGGTLLAFFGVYLIVKSPEVSIHKMWPIWLLLIAAFFYALSAILIKVINHINPLSITIWSSFFAVPQLLLLSHLFENHPLTKLVDVSPHIWLILSISAILSLIGFFIWNYLIHLYPVNQIVPFALLIPVFALLASYFILGETTHRLALVGGVMAMGGVWLQAREQQDSK